MSGPTINWREQLELMEEHLGERIEAVVLGSVFKRFAYKDAEIDALPTPADPIDKAMLAAQRAGTFDTPLSRDQALAWLDQDVSDYHSPTLYAWTPNWVAFVSNAWGEQGWKDLAWAPRAPMGIMPMLNAETAKF